MLALVTKLGDIYSEVLERWQCSVKYRPARPRTIGKVEIAQEQAVSFDVTCGEHGHETASCDMLTVCMHAHESDNRLHYHTSINSNNRGQRSVCRFSSDDTRFR